MDSVTSYLDHAGTGSHPIIASADEAIDRLQRSASGMDRETAKRLCERILETTSAGVRWRWDARLRTSAGLQLSDAFADGVDLAAIPVPTTIVVGAYSDASRVPPPGLRPVVLAGGHNLHHDCPDELAAIIASAVAPALAETSDLNVESCAG
jgi:pimeloyl-ACP methyl ester carboxylesterase